MPMATSTPPESKTKEMDSSPFYTELCIKYLNFGNFTEEYDHVNTLLGLPQEKGRRKWEALRL